MESGLVEHLVLKSSKISGDGDRDRLETDLSGIDGVRDVEVDPNANSVDIAFDPTIVNATRLQASVEEMGYSLENTGGKGDESDAAAFLGSDMTGADRGSATDTAGAGGDDAWAPGFRGGGDSSPTG